MIAAIMIGRKESKGFPGKNTAQVFGRPLFAYPLKAVAAVKCVNTIVVSTDDQAIHDYIKERTASPYRGTPIRCVDRPSWLCSDEAQAGAVYQYVYKEICLYDTSILSYELLVLLMCNAPMVTPQLIEQGIAALRADPSLDSAITVSSYNMWNPSRARRIDNGLLTPFVLVDGATCDRNSVGDTWFADFGAVIVRPRCLEKLDGLPPQPWMGHRIYPLKSWGGFDIDYCWQLPQIEYWLHQNGYTELA
jgi:CMP-N-acetylneuraminic acid synthetase